MKKINLTLSIMCVFFLIGMSIVFAQSYGDPTLIPNSPQVTVRQPTFFEKLLHFGSGSFMSIQGLQAVYHPGDAMEVYVQETLINKDCSGEAYLVFDLYSGDKYHQTTSNKVYHKPYDIGAGPWSAGYLNPGGVYDFTIPSNAPTGTWSASSYLWCDSLANAGATVPSYSTVCGGTQDNCPNFQVSVNAPIPTQTCGNGIIEGTEVCDGTKTFCTDNNNYVGLAPCIMSGSNACKDFDWNNCKASEYCGDGIKNGNENCDKSDVGTYTCSKLGFVLGGTLKCSSSCKFDTSSCILATPVNGACGTTTNSCTAGILNDIADSSTAFLWQCTGTNGGQTASCNKPMVIGGVCGSTNNACTTGTLVDIADSSTNYLWQCQGLNGGSVASCSVAKTCTPLEIVGIQDQSSFCGSITYVYDTCGNQKTVTGTLACGSGKTCTVDNVCGTTGTNQTNQTNPNAPDFKISITNYQSALKASDPATTPNTASITVHVVNNGGPGSMFLESGIYDADTIKAWGINTQAASSYQVVTNCQAYQTNVQTIKLTMDAGATGDYTFTFNIPPYVALFGATKDYYFWTDTFNSCWSACAPATGQTSYDFKKVVLSPGASFTGTSLATECSDGVKDADETDVDCGGSCDSIGKKCGPQNNCIYNTDCAGTSICQGNPSPGLAGITGPTYGKCSNSNPCTSTNGTTPVVITTTTNQSGMTSCPQPNSDSCIPANCAYVDGSTKVLFGLYSSSHISKCCSGSAKKQYSVSEWSAKPVVAALAGYGTWQLGGGLWSTTAASLAGLTIGNQVFDSVSEQGICETGFDYCSLNFIPGVDCTVGLGIEGAGIFLLLLLLLRR